jgi:hypothetical protein
MLELVKVLVTAISKLFDPDVLRKWIDTLRSLTGRDADTQIDQAGAKLFMLHMTLIDIVSKGDEILNRLDEYIANMSSYLNSEKDYWALAGLRGYVGDRLDQQRVNVRKFLHALDELRPELFVVDSQAAAQLFSGISMKMAMLHNAIEELQRVNSQAAFRAALTKKEVLWYIKKIASEISSSKDGLVVLGPTDVEIQNLVHTQLQDRDEEYNKICNSLERWTLSSRAAWNESVFLKVKQFIEERNPRGQLEGIRQAAEHLRSSLEKCFDLRKILWIVGNPKFRESYIRSF